MQAPAYTKNPDGTIRLFERPFLERFTHVHPIVPLLFWSPVIVALYYRTFALHQMALSQTLALSVAGLVIWTLSEYLLHRFVFHLEPWGPISTRIMFLFHGIHHEAPNDKTRLVMPPVAGVMIAAVLFPIFYFMWGPVNVEPFFAAFLIGYLCYDYIHYATHHFRMQGPVGSFLKRYHMRHHFMHPDAMYGVSSPLWDVVFRTFKR